MLACFRIPAVINLILNLLPQGLIQRVFKLHKPGHQRPLIYVFNFTEVFISCLIINSQCKGCKCNMEAGASDNSKSHHINCKVVSKICPDFSTPSSAPYATLHSNWESTLSKSFQEPTSYSIRAQAIVVLQFLKPCLEQFFSARLL